MQWNAGDEKQDQGPISKSDGNPIRQEHNMEKNEMYQHN
jgi:hypothetical protein